jgi:hypothetical protein
MQHITLDDKAGFVNLTQLSGITSTDSLIVTNNCPQAIYLQHSVLPPTEGVIGYPLFPGKSANMGLAGYDVWALGDGDILVQELLPAITDYSGVDLPHDLYTSDREHFRRLRVDPGQTGFFEGREFRTFKEFSIPTATPYIIKFVSPIDFILWQQHLFVDSESVKLSIIIGGTEGGTFSDVLPLIGKNRMSTRKTPFYEPVVSITGGGTLTGGTVVEVVRVLTAGAGGQRTTVGASQSDERGLPAGTYYVKLENYTSGTSTGTYSIVWEERP